MNYYRRYMGDYAKKTASLSLAEHGAYGLLLDQCYSTELPLPAEYDALYRLCRAMTVVEQDAVKSIADRFFPVCDDGLRRNPRASEEIEKAQSTIQKQRESGVESARKRWLTDRSTHELTDGLTNESTDPAAIQPPTTNHQERTKPSRASRSALNGAFTAFWDSYPRKKSKGDAEKAWIKIKPDEQLTERILHAVEQAKTSADWQREAGRFIPHPASWLNAKGWEDETGRVRVIPAGGSEVIV